MPFKKGQPGGPGRPKKADKFARPIARAEKQIADRLPEIVEAQIALALGVMVQEVDKESGALIVYQRPPDARAGQYLIDRILGKPTERQEISGPDGAPIEVDDARDRLLDRLTRRAADADESGTNSGAT